MAKTSIVERGKKRQRLHKRHGQKIRLQKAVLCNPAATEEERTLAEKILQRLPRDASRCRQRNRCALCGRPRGFNRLTGLCRIHMRMAVMNGMVPGMHKSSW